MLSANANGGFSENAPPTTSVPVLPSPLGAAPLGPPKAPPTPLRSRARFALNAAAAAADWWTWLPLASAAFSARCAAASASTRLGRLVALLLSAPCSRRNLLANTRSSSFMPPTCLLPSLKSYPPRPTPPSCCASNRLPSTFSTTRIKRSKRCCCSACVRETWATRSVNLELRKRRISATRESTASRYSLSLASSASCTRARSASVLNPSPGTGHSPSALCSPPTSSNKPRQVSSSTPGGRIFLLAAIWSVPITFWK